MLPTLWRRMWFFLRQRRLREELQSELAFHLAMKEEEQAAAGLSQEEARYAARSQMGSLSLALEESRDVWVWTALEQWSKDFHHALRVLRRSPVFTLCAVFILALGIGVNGAIFTLIDALLLRPLPVPEPQRLQQISLRGNGGDLDNVDTLNYRLFEDVRSRTHCFSGLFTWNPTNLSLGWGPSARAIVAAAISGEGYRTLDVRAQQGRLLEPADDVPGTPLYAVISDRFWEQAFSRNPSAVGRTLLLNRKPFIIIGVTPRFFNGVLVGTNPDVTISIHADADLSPERNLVTETRFSNLFLFGRLKTAITDQAAQRELAAITPAVFKEQISRDAEFWHGGHRFLPKTLGLRPVIGTSVPAQQWRQSLWTIHAIAIFMLLMTGINLTSLCSVRTMGRHKELAVRVALGSGQFRLIRQLLTESLLLCLAGLAGGILMARFGATALLAILSDSDAPLAIDRQPDWRITVFMAALVLATTALVGLAPILEGTQVGLSDALKQSTTGPVKGTSRLLSRVLVVLQVGFAVVLITGSLLFLQTVRNLKRQNLGLDRHNLVFVSLDASQAGWQKPQQAQFYTDLLEKLRRNPSFRFVSLANITPIAGMFSWQTLATDLWPALNAKQRMLYQFDVTPQYLETMGLPLWRGRDFIGSDSRSVIPVAILNKLAAQTYFPGKDPVGQILRISTGKTYRIVGEVGDAKYASLREKAPPTIYFKTDGYASYVLAVRATVDRAIVLRQVRAALQQTGKDVQVGEAISMTEQIDRALTSERLLAFVASFFACVAAVLVAVGLIGSVGYAVSRRTSEIGVRLALGSSRIGILWLLARSPFGQCLLGLVVGVPLAIATAHLARSFLYGLLPYDPLVLSLAVLLILFVTGIGVLLPTLRAARLEPVSALRYE